VYRNNPKSHQDGEKGKDSRRETKGNRDSSEKGKSNNVSSAKGFLSTGRIGGACSVDGFKKQSNES
jgi:hypothetical protein